MWYCEDKLKRKTARFGLPSVAQKRPLFKLLTISEGEGRRGVAG